MDGYAFRYEVNNQTIIDLSIIFTAAIVSVRGLRLSFQNDYLLGSQAPGLLMPCSISWIWSKWPAGIFFALNFADFHMNCRFD